MKKSVDTFVHRTFSDCIQTRGGDTVSAIKVIQHTPKHLLKSKRWSHKGIGKKHLEKNPTKPFWRYIKVYIRFPTQTERMCISETVKTKKKISQRGTSNQRIKRNCIQFTDDFEGKRSKPHHVQSTNKCCSPRHVRNRAEAAGLLFIQLINKRFLWMWIVLSVESKIQTFVSGCLFHSVTTPSLFPVCSVFWRVGGT